MADRESFREFVRFLLDRNAKNREGITVKHLLELGADFAMYKMSTEGQHSIISSKAHIAWKRLHYLWKKGAHFRIGIWVCDERRLQNAGLFRNVELCTKIFINKFNSYDLPKVFEAVPGASEILPNIERLKIAYNSNAAQIIAKQVSRMI